MTAVAASATPSSLTWSLVLLPDQGSAELRVDPRSLAVHHEVIWRSRTVGLVDIVSNHERLPEGPVERLTCRAVDEAGVVVARSTIVTIPPGPPHRRAAACCVAPPPRPQRLQRRSTLIVTRDEVRDFGTRLAGHYPLHERATDAWAAGFTNLLVPGGLLVAIHAAPPVPDAGRIAVWFTEPVAVGTALELAQDSSDPEVWALLRVGDHRVVTLARRTAFDRSMERSAFGDDDSP